MLEALAGLVRASGRNLLKWRGTAMVHGTWAGTQLKIPADRAAHAFLLAGLHAIAPDIPVVSEEDPGSWAGISAGEYFMIDPIDGTASYAGGFDGFVTQAALVRGNRVELSAICAPVSGALYTARRGDGAFLNGARMAIREKNRWETIIDNYPEPRGITALAWRALDLGTYIESGSISLKICRVADGTADIFFKDVLVHAWDVAAPHLVLEEAGGGILRDISGAEIAYGSTLDYQGIVAANSDGNAKRLLAWYSNLMKSRGTP